MSTVTDISVLREKLLIYRGVQQAERSRRGSTSRYIHYPVTTLSAKALGTGRLTATYPHSDDCLVAGEARYKPSSVGVVSGPVRDPEGTTTQNGCE